jgi:hypothetical protein
LPEFNLQRRNTLKVLGLALGAPFIGPLLLKALAVEAISKNDLSQFLKVSAFLLGVPDSGLDLNVARVYWARLSKTLKAHSHLAALYGIAEQGDVAISSESQLPTDEARGFAKKIILLWYTGVFETPSGRKRLFYSESLMFSFFSKDRPAPGLCSGSPESWTKPPIA